ncbi:MAG TPA: AraC family transcriptional regulator [Streptosporangiaceae bacterium]
MTGDDRGGDWARYWRADQPSGPVEAMHAHFRSHVYHRHSHETYSFGVTDDGAQAFTCRGDQHVSTANMVMLFNPDDPHDGHAATGPGFTYRMIHIAPDLVRELFHGAGKPLFPTPVVDDPELAHRLRQLHTALTTSPGSLGSPRSQSSPSSQDPPDPPSSLQQHEPAKAPVPLRQHQLLSSPTSLQQHEQLTATSLLLARHATRATLIPPGSPASALIASRVRAMLHDAYASPLTADELAAAAGCSRFTATRAFTTVYGLAPSDYQRQLRLRAARSLLTGGATAAEAAACAGFADQAHLTRWFRRCYGVTPGAYRQAVGSR